MKRNRGGLPHGFYGDSCDGKAGRGDGRQLLMTDPIHFLSFYLIFALVALGNLIVHCPAFLFPRRAIQEGRSGPICP
jgi:hypothetical protein